MVEQAGLEPGTRTSSAVRSSETQVTAGIPMPGSQPREGKSVLAFPFPKPRQGVLVNSVHLEPPSENSYNHSTNVRQHPTQPAHIYEK